MFDICIGIIYMLWGFMLQSSKFLVKQLFCANVRIELLVCEWFVLLIIINFVTLRWRLYCSWLVWSDQLAVVPRVGSGVVRIDPLRFLARWCKRRLNQALSVLSLSLGFFWVCAVLLTRNSLGCVIFMLFVCSVIWLFLLGCQYQCKWLTGKTRLRNDL